MPHTHSMISSAEGGMGAIELPQDLFSKDLFLIPT